MPTHAATVADHRSHATWASTGCPPAWAALLMLGVVSGCANRQPLQEPEPLRPSRIYAPAEAQLGELPALYNCNGREVVVGRVGLLARVTLGPEQADLVPVPGHAGQRFVGQETGQSTWASRWTTSLTVERHGINLNWQGQLLGACRLVRWLPQTLQGQGYALGHAPGWAFSIDPHGARIQWEAQGQQPPALEAIKLNPGQALALGEPFAFGDAVVSSKVTVTQEVCVDGRSEWPRPYRVEVRRDGQTLVGCGGNTLSLLQNKVWTYPAQAMPGDPHRATLRFDAAGRLTGDSGCNHVHSAYRLEGSFLKLQSPTTSRKSCLGTVMAFEKNLLEWLPKVSRFQMSAAGELKLLTADGRAFELR